MSKHSSPFFPINCIEVGSPSSVKPLINVMVGCPEKFVGAENRTNGAISSRGVIACGGTSLILGAGVGIPGHTITSMPDKSSSISAFVACLCLVARA